VFFLERVPEIELRVACMLAKPSTELLSYILVLRIVLPACELKMYLPGYSYRTLTQQWQNTLSSQVHMGCSPGQIIFQAIKQSLIYFKGLKSYKMCSLTRVK
jgi:hypothetical protein